MSPGVDGRRGGMMKVKKVKGASPRPAQDDVDLMFRTRSPTHSHHSFHPQAIMVGFLDDFDKQLSVAYNAALKSGELIFTPSEHFKSKETEYQIEV